MESAKSAIAAWEGGATRLEVCGALSEGGLTPSIGLLRVILSRSPPNKPCMVMVRPRAGDFLYDDVEVATMLADIDALGAELCRHSARLADQRDGFVIGALRADGHVDEDLVAMLLERIAAVAPGGADTPVTFHRAVDMAADYAGAVETIATKFGPRRGCRSTSTLPDRGDAVDGPKNETACIHNILTSGGAATAQEGMQELATAVRICTPHGIRVVAGGGVNESNVKLILARTRVHGLHGSARRSVVSNMKFRKSGVYMGNARGDDAEFVRREVHADVLVGWRKETGDHLSPGSTLAAT